MNVIRLLVAAVVLCAALPAAAAEWMFDEVRGRVALDGVELTSGTQIDRGGVVETGQDSGVVVSRGAQRIEIGPLARIVLPMPVVARTTIDQQAGRATYDVDRRNTPHFEVRTRLVAALVKGTRFTVEADGDAHAVAVEEGLVQVTGGTGVAAELVAAGYRATVGTGNELSVAPAPKATRTSNTDRPGNGQQPNAQQTSVDSDDDQGVQPAAIVDGRERNDAAIQPTAPAQTPTQPTPAPVSPIETPTAEEPLPAPAMPTQPDEPEQTPSPSPAQPAIPEGQDDTEDAPQQGGQTDPVQDSPAEPAQPAQPTEPTEPEPAEPAQETDGSAEPPATPLEPGPTDQPDTVDVEPSEGEEEQPVVPTPANVDRGQENTLDGFGFVVEGDRNDLVGSYHDVFGNDNVVSGELNFVRGDRNRVSGLRDVLAGEATAPGFNNTVWGNGNTVDGSSNTIGSSGQTVSNNDIRGVWNNVLGNDNYVEGDYNKVVGDGNEVLGSYNDVRGNDNYVDGDRNVVDGNLNRLLGGSNDNDITGDENRLNRSHQNLVIRDGVDLANRIGARLFGDDDDDDDEDD